MREILFRGKRVDNGEWVHGYLIVYEDADKKEPYILTEKALSSGLDIGGWIDGAQANEVILDTVGQYTGLKDKNGKMIFEGDIVCGAGDFNEEDGYGALSWDKETSRFIITGTEIVTDFDCIYGFELEVIGNIHDNPELLKGD